MPVFLLLGSLLLASVQNPLLKVTNCDLGEVRPFATASCFFEIENTRDRRIAVSIAADASGDTIEPKAAEIAPHEHARFTVRAAMGNTAGEFRRTFHAAVVGTSPSDDQTLTATGFALSSLAQPFPQLDFGSVDLSTGPHSRDVKLESQDVAGLKIARVLSAPAGIGATIGVDGATLIINVLDDAVWGVTDDYVKVALENAPQAEAWVRVHAEIHGEVVPKGNPAWMGVSTAKEISEILIPLKRSDGRPFKIGSATLEKVKGHVDVTACEPKSSACQALRLVVSDQQPSGSMRGTIIVDLPDFSRKLALQVWAVLRPPSSRDASSPERKKSVEHVPPPVDRSPTNSNAVEPAPSVVPNPPAALPTIPGTGPLLKWSVADDGGVYGYQIFRSSEQTGPFLRQNEATIVADASRPKGVNTYQWRDSKAKKGETYWYYIGAVGKDGSKRQLSPPQRKVVAP